MQSKKASAARYVQNCPLARLACVDGQTPVIRKFTAKVKVTAKGSRYGNKMNMKMKAKTYIEYDARKFEPKH
jgi:hypothetical protein